MCVSNVTNAAEVVPFKATRAVAEVRVEAGVVAIVATMTAEAVVSDCVLRLVVCVFHDVMGCRDRRRCAGGGTGHRG